ncbi:MAG: preprotein translocase subunit SecE [Cyanobacteria bacterium J06642_2]
MAKSDSSGKDSRLDPAKRGKSQQEVEADSGGAFGFLRSTRDELDKVVWPSRQQLISESVAVFAIVVAFAAFIFAIDRLFSWVAQQVF